MNTLTTNAVNTSPKHYWTQTVKLTGIMFALAAANLIGCHIAGIDINSSQGNGIDLVASALSIAAAVKLYAGYGFWKGWGGLICAKVGTYGMFFLVGALSVATGIS